MKIEWDSIKEKVINNISDILKTGTPSYIDLNEGLELMRKAILYKTNIPQLDGLPRIILPALQEAYFSKKGEIGPIRVIADSIEPYLKKLLILVKNKNFDEITDLTLISLFKSLELNKQLNSQTYGGFPQLEKENLPSFSGKPEYLEYLCHTRLIRNEVHNSPNWNEIEVFTHLRNILVVFLYATIKYKNNLVALPNKEQISPTNQEYFQSQENKMLYDFISFGNTTTEIKTQVMNSFILHFLIESPDSQITVIEEKANSYFKKSLNTRFYERKINDLIQKQKIEYSDRLKNKVRLTEQEHTRLTRIQNNFAENKELFLLYFEEITTKYGIEEHSQILLENLTNFFVSNFNIDVFEAYDKGIEITENENSIYTEFISYLKSITVDQPIAEALFRDLLVLCQDSDFLIRMCASRVFSSLTNPDQFQNYIRQQVRNVYLDTQIILHALCLGYCKNIKYENIYYKITDELIDFVKDNPNIKLKVSKLYLSEVTYQLKLALLLIPFEDFAKSNYSNNVFYLFYNYLKENDKLDEEDTSFGEFLKSWLLVTEDDAYGESFEQIMRNNLLNILKDELHVETIHIPVYENRDSAVRVLEKVLKDKLYKPKPYNVLVNDALMVCHLADREFHINEPFFLTWDKTFTEFRREFKNQFSRTELISWHLFSPSKFLNHMSLLDFIIDPKTITNEYLSILDSFGLHEKTQTIYDSMNKFLDLKNISKEQRRKYIRIANDIFNEKEFSYNVNQPEESPIESLSISFGEIIDNINSYFHRTDAMYSIEMYRQAMSQEKYFIKIANIVVDEIKKSIEVGSLGKSHIKKITSVITEYEKEIKAKHSS
jgi:hypothetical protein